MKKIIMALVISCALLLSCRHGGSDDQAQLPPVPAPTQWVALGADSASGGGISGNTGDSLEPAIALDLLGNPIVAWTDTSLGPKEIYLKRWSGSAWEEMGGSATGGGISQNGGNSLHPSIIIDLNGNPIVAWEDYSNSGDPQIYVRRWNPSGAGTWEELDNSGTTWGISASGTATEPSVSIDASGNPVVAWSDNGSIHIKRWNPGTVKWEEVGTGSATGNGVSNSVPANRPSLDFPMAAWWGCNSCVSNEIYFRHFESGSWVELGFNSAINEGISDDSEDSFNPRVRIDPNGQPIIAWGGSGIHVKTYNTSSCTWVNIGPGLLPGSEDVTILALDVDPQGNPVVAWSNNSPGDPKIYVKRWNGSTWAEIGAGSASGGGIGGGTSPSIVIAPSNSYYVVWDTNGYPGDAEIYVKRYSP